MCLSALLVVGLISLPAMASPATASLGVVLQADRAKVGASRAVSGATVFDGDRLETELAGQLRVRFGTSQAHLFAGSSALVHQSADGFDAELDAGSVVLSTAENEIFSLTANGAIVRPATPHAVIAQITRVSPSELLLSSRKGSLEVTFEGETSTLTEGNSYRMLIEEEAQAPQGSRPAGRTRRRAMFILLGAAGVATGIGIWRAVVSPSSPE
jgi:hypothetical protein